MDGTIIAARADGIDRIDAATGEVLASVALDTAPVPTVGSAVSRMDLSESDGLLLVATAEPSVVLFDISSLGFDPLWEAESDGTLVSLSLSPEGQVAAWSDDENRVYAVDGSGQERFSFDIDDAASVLRQAPEGLVVADMPVVAFVDGIPVWSVVEATDQVVFVAAGALLHRLDLDGRSTADPQLSLAWTIPVPHRDIEVSGDRLVAVAGEVFHERDLENLVELRSMTLFEDTVGGGRPNVASVVFVDEFVHAGMEHGEIWTFDRTSGAKVSSLKLGLGPVADVSVDASGRRLVASHTAGLTIVALDGAGPLTTSAPRDPGLTHFSMSASGDRVVLGPPGVPQAPTVWDFSDAQRPVLI